MEKLTKTQLIELIKNSIEGEHNNILKALSEDILDVQDLTRIDSIIEMYAKSKKGKIGLFLDLFHFMVYNKGLDIDDIIDGRRY